MNLFHEIPDSLPEEHIQTLLSAAGLRIERIVSGGQASPPGFWYDQPEHEWVLLVKGAARLQIGDEIRELQAGDFVNIPAHCRHRVDWTDPNQATIWLAIFYG